MVAKNDPAMEITGEEFNEIINNSHRLVIVDFFAEWCLSPGTKLVFNPCVKNIEKIKNGSKILSFDKNLNESFANVKSTHKILSNKKIKIITERGREIECTPEHLILTDRSFKKAENLKVEDNISTYLFSSNFPDIENDSRIFLTENDLRKTAKELGLDNEKYFKELKEKNLLELKYNDERAHILANLIGFLLTDGSLSMQKNNERSAEFFVARNEDIKEIEKDLKFLGFDASSRKQESKGQIAGREFIQKTNRVRISKTSFFILLATLGGIVGKKFIKGLKTPKWILEGPKEIQRSFLKGFLGGDGPKLEIRTINREKGFYNKPLINPIEFHFYDNSENSPEKFVQELLYLLNNMGVEVRKIEIEKEKRYKRKDKKVSLLLKIFLKTNLNSAYNYSLIGFKYCYTKNYVSSLAREYLRERLEKIKKRRELKSQVLEIKDKFSISELAKKFRLSYSVVKNWIEGKEVAPPNDAMRYEEWINKYLDNKIIYDQVRHVKNFEGEQYPFISVSLDNDTKMFVANGIIHHNCMPCLMLSPVIEELADKLKDVKFVKINVDDNKELASKFGILSIPCLIIFKDGKEVDRLVGSQTGESIEEKVKGFLG